MEILEKKHLKEVVAKLEGRFAEIEESVNKQKLLLYKLVEVKQTERHPLIVTRKEAMRLLGGISVWKIYQLVEQGYLNPTPLGGEGRKMYRVSELESLVNNLEDIKIEDQS